MDQRVIDEIKGTIITVRHQDKNKKFDLASVFAIDENNLIQEYADQAAVYAFFGALAAKADFDAALIGLSKDQEMAKADDSFRAELERDGKKYTEPVIKAMIATDEECVKLSESELSAKYDTKILKAVCTALEMRANMLVSLGSHLRHEMDQMGMNIKRRELDSAVDDAKKAMRSRR